MKPFWAFVLFAAFARCQNTHPIAGRVRIEKTAAGVVRFYPAEVVAWAGDQIHWFNDTADLHEPGVINKDGSFVSLLEEPLSPKSVSAVFSPLARCDNSDKQIAFTIRYVCGRHRNEQGVIQVIPTP
jgi:hypothetical protein